MKMINIIEMKMINIKENYKINYKLYLKANTREYKGTTNHFKYEMLLIKNNQFAGINLREKSIPSNTKLYLII